MSELSKNVFDKLQKALPEAGIELRSNPGPAGQDSLLVSGEDLLDVCRCLREGHDFDLLTNVTGVDWPDAALADKVAAAPESEDDSGEEKESVESEGLLEVVYHLYSTTKRVGPIVLRARTANRSDQVDIPSVVSVYRSAEFQEREVYDLYGVNFTGHPDLRRILMWDEFEDHPMRKDYEAPDDYEYEPTPHDEVLEKAKRHHS